MKPSGSLELAAPAKVNLFLHVGPPKANGRHDLESLVVFAESIADRLVFEAADAFGFDSPENFNSALGPASDNLVVRAGLAIQRHVGRDLPAKVTLHKRLPIAAGIGGGSSDAAATLQGLNRFLCLDLCQSSLMGLAAPLGGDVPVCVLAQPAWMRGEGETVSPTGGLPPLPAVLVNPGVPCPTGAVFAAYDRAARFAALVPPPFAQGASRQSFLDWLAETRNDLQSVAIDLVPEIGVVLDALESQPGAAFVRMSGSGATCFAVFDRDDTARAAADRLAASHGSWWVRSTRLGGSGFDGARHDP